MRYDVHKAFKERFGIKGVEIFGATEGNCLLFNVSKLKNYEKKINL